MGIEYFDIEWTNDDAQGCRDLIPVSWFHTASNPIKKFHTIYPSKGKGFEAQCIVSVSKRGAVLRYPEGQPNEDKLFIGELRLGFGSAVRSEIESIKWRDDPADKWEDLTEFAKIERVVLEEKPTTAKRLVEVRKGQARFRAQLDAKWDQRCAVTGIGIRELLRASHIDRWADNKAARLDAENGLLLSANLDALFDKGLISFSDRGILLWREGLQLEGLMELASVKGLRTEPSREQRKYLRAHRERYNFG